MKHAMFGYRLKINQKLGWIEPLTPFGTSMDHQSTILLIMAIII